MRQPHGKDFVWSAWRWVALGVLLMPAIPVEAGQVPPPKQAVEPAAPVLPGEVVTALQGGRYAEAIAALDKLAADPKAGAEAESKAYFALVKGIALRLDRKPDQARTALADALKAYPKSRWAVKLRSELVRVELAAMRPAEAEALARAEVQALLADDRKDTLAEVYHDFARKLLKPTDPTVAPEPQAAYELLVQARGLAKGETLRARLLFEMARADQAASNWPRAIEDFRAYLAEFPKGADRTAARFHLGEAQLAAGQPLPARLTWTDLARDLEGKDDKAAVDFRARSLFQIAATYGMPTPGDDATLNLGVGALRRFLTAYPSHPLAVKAAYQIGVAYQNRGKSQEALAALNSFLKGDDFRAETDEARKDLAELAMSAQFLVGQILQGQARFDEAIAAFRGYLAKYPDGPQSANAQRAILAAELQAAGEFRRREQFEKARTAWRAFAAQYPLDGNVPQVLFAIGESFEAEKKDAEAIAAWETLIGKFPGTEPAAHAEFQIGFILENRKGEPAAAIERYKKITVDPWRSSAAQRIAVMEANALAVVTPRTFRSGEVPTLKVMTRNLQSLTFSAYKLDAESYFRKKHDTGGVEGLDIGLVAPDFEWSLDVPGYDKYKPIERDYELKPLPVPGVYVVKVSDETHLQATTLVMASDIDAIVKASRDQLLVYVQDMKGGAGRAGARVLVATDAGVVLEGATGEDGVLLRDWDSPHDPNCHLHYLILDGGNVAGSGLGLPGTVAQGLTPRAYIATDRPVYRPGQEVEVRGIVREIKDGQYDHVPGAKYRFEVFDSRGRQIVGREVTLSEFGTFHQRVPIDEGAPIGGYRVRVFQPNGSDFGGAFEVQAYQLRKVDLALDLPRTIFFRGEKVEGTAVARYPYGTPLAGRQVAVALPDGRTLQGTTDAAGKFAFSFETEGFAEEQALRVVARLPEENVAAAALLQLAVRAFRIDVATDRGLYLVGETIPTRLTTLDVHGEPIGQDLTVRLIRQVVENGVPAEREVAKSTIKTDPKTGKATLPLVAKDEDGGTYIVRVAGTDKFGNPIVTDRALAISGKKDAVKLHLLADRTEFKVDEPAKVNLHNRSGAGPVLLTWEADRILTYKIVAVRDGDNAVAWQADGKQFPNFTLTAARMAGTEFHQARLDLAVVRDLSVTITPKKAAVGPGDEVEVEVTTRDQLGRPVSAEVALALVDRALLRLYQDKMPPIGPFFHNQSRVGAFSTEATNTFAYRPRTVPVAEAVVEEQERLLAQERNNLDADWFRQQAAGQLAFGAQAPAKAIPMNAPGSGGMPNFQANGHASSSFAGLAEQPRGGVVSADDFDGSSKEESDARNSKDDKLGRFYALDPMSTAGDAPAEGGRDFSTSMAGKRRERGPARQQTVETAYWNPAVVTDKDGKATIKFPAPTALAEYRFTARAVTGRETLAGQATGDLAVRKDFYVELKTLAVLTEGDKPRFLGRLHHVGVKGPAEIRLEIYAGGAEKVLPKSVEWKGDGVEELLFDAFEIPDGDQARLTLSAKAGDASDQITVEVPIRPWGRQAFASASGTSGDDATVFVGLPAGRAYENPEMLVVVSPTTRRMLVELALGQECFPMASSFSARILPPAPRTIADRASDLLATTSALAYLWHNLATDAPEAARLTDRIRGQVAELIAGQNEDGGWPWVPGQGKPSDRRTSAHATWALASAETLGLLPDVGVADRATTYLGGEFARVDGGDHDTRAAILHALGTRRKATFEQANALNRLRQNLSNVALSYLALTFTRLDRAALADEVVGVLIPRSKTEAAEPGSPPRRFWDGSPNGPWCREPVEATALAALAIAQARPGADELSQAITWLNAHRVGLGWQPHKAKGPALAALAAYHGKARAAEDRYTLVVKVNDAEVHRVEVAGAAEGKAIRVPRKALKAGDKNRVSFDIEGRGTFGYAVTLTGFTRDFGPDQDRANRSAGIHRRVYWAPEPTLDGRPLPQGFGVAVNVQGFENHASQLPLGGKTTVSVEAWRNDPAGQPVWERDFLVLEEPLPAGATFVDGSIRSSAAYHEVDDGVLRLYFTPDQYPSCTYDIVGFVPGEYRALPSEVRSVYEPGRLHVGQPGALKILAPGEASTDPYRPTPDQLYARGKALFDAGKLADAAKALDELVGGYTLRDDVAKDAARMLLTTSIANYDAGRVVRFFEILKEKAPELVIPFDQILVVGRAYRDIGEAERAYLVWRATAEASYLEDARVGEVLRQRGRPLEAVAFLIDLWRSYPDTAPIESDFFGLSQVVAGLAAQAIDNPAIRRELAKAEITRSALLLQSIRLVQTFLALAPTNPVADEASLAQLGSLLDLEDYETVVTLARRYAELYPKSTYLDSFQYSEALGRFHLGQYDRAVEVAEAIAKATYKDGNGVDQPSPNKWQALYILGQIFDARRQPAKALDFYKQVADRFGDAAGAVKALTREALVLPEVTVVRPKGEAVAGVGLRAIPVDEPKKREDADELAKDQPGVALAYRNVAKADVKVYKVDLMRLYLTRRNLNEIAGIDLAGITPLVSKEVDLGEGADYDDKNRPVPLPLDEEGAYLVMARGGNRYASGVMLVTPLELEVLEEADLGRVRVLVRDARTKDPVPKVQVQVIGSDNAKFISGRTDLRGVFVAEGVRGQVTAVARQGTNRYAFHRGTTYVGVPVPAVSEAPNPEPKDGVADLQQEGQSLELNIQLQNSGNRAKQLKRLEERYKSAPGKGVQVEKAY